MNRYIPWNEIYVFGGISLFALIGVLISVFTNQEWTWIKVLLIILIPGSLIGLSIFIVLQKWMSRPDYITKHGVSIWTTTIGWPHKKDMEIILDYFIKNSFVEIITRAMLKNVRIRWHNKPITKLSQQGWIIRNAAFIQKGKQIEIARTKDIASGALFTALIHMYREIVLKLEPDREYTDLMWALVENLIRGWKRD